MHCTPKMPGPCLHPCAIFALMCQAFKMQLRLHNSVDQGFSKFVYLRLCLVVCFYPWPPSWPWSWGYTYLYLPVCLMLSLCFFSGHFENSSTIFIVGSEKHQKVCQQHPYFLWDFNKIMTPFSKCSWESFDHRDERRGCSFLMVVSKIACPSSLLVARDAQRSIKNSLFSLKLQQDCTTIL